MKESTCDILIVGGGTGGVAAAIAACDLGMQVILTEETDWIGGQLTSQAVPPDEHPWIEQFGCTRRYRQFRNNIREFYRQWMPLTRTALDQPELNPGGGWVSKLCHEPRIAWLVLNQMLQRYISAGILDIRLRRIPTAATVHGDELEGVSFRNLESGADETVSARFFLDATELGDLLPLSGTEYVIGAESKGESEEPNAVEGPPQPDNVQGLTWVMAVAHDEGSHRLIDKPERYEFWRSYKPEFWPGPLLGFEVLHAHTGEPRTLPLFSDDWYALFPYRQIVDSTKLTVPAHPVTLVNWPQNDYFDQTILDVSDADRASRLEDARQLSLSLLYWLQTEAPRHDGGTGYPGLYLRPDITGTEDGLAKAPYIRESRRIKAQFTVTEQMVATYTNPDLKIAPRMPASVGIGSYRIDLHPSTSGSNMIDTSTLPFEIPLGALIPQRVKNLLPACKNIGVTHITNGCYRLHPVEWNIGESSAIVASYSILTNSLPIEILSSDKQLSAYQQLLGQVGIELHWPTLGPI